MARASSAIRQQWLQIVAAVGFAAALTALMVLGTERAAELQSVSGALQLASELRSRPEFIRSQLTLIQRGLEARVYVGQALRAIGEVRRVSDADYATLRRELTVSGRGTLAESLDAPLARWQQLDGALEAVALKRATLLYNDSATGSELTPSGRQLKSAVDAVLSAQAQNMSQLGEGLGQLAAALRSTVDESGRSLRTLLLAGTAVAALLLVLMLYFGWRSRQAGAAAAEAQRQISNILGTVREGLFLLGRDLRLGEAYSLSLSELLRMPSPAGHSFEELLRPLTDERTLSAAQKYIGLLWKERVHEELIESVNPLSQLEVLLDNGHGGRDTRYLTFSFRRVRGTDTSGDYILGVVSDVTDHVLLARELEHAKTDNDSQAALLLQLLNVDAMQLRQFLASADAACRKSNATLRAPGKEQEDLKHKLNAVFRELHAVKGEAGALGLVGYSQRVHAIEDSLAQLRARDSLSGNDFMAVVIQLDELLGYGADVQGLRARIAQFRGEAVVAEIEPGAHIDTTVIEELPLLAPPGVGAANLEQTLRALGRDVAQAQGRVVKLLMHGLEQVPASYAAVVKDICIQMIRNAVVHGIEPAHERAALGKADRGTVSVSFSADGDDDYLLTVEDDGCGLNHDQILNKALQSGLLQPQQAAALDRGGVLRVIFQPGFSTAAEVSEHSGRGVGLDAVSHLVRERGGRINLSTSQGQYTRFRVQLPKAAATQPSASSA
jgi:two-component system chemotaxis sensor kinase CheA